MAKSQLTSLITCPSFSFFKLRGIIEFVASLMGYGEVCEGSECAICLCRITRGKETDALRCRHVFHKLCLEKWVKFNRGNSCPLCRESLISAATASAAAPPTYGEGFPRTIVVSPFGESRRRDLFWIR